MAYILDLHLTVSYRHVFPIIYLNDYNWKSCIPGYDILEVKFDFTIPPWFHRIIQNYQLKRLSVSKFVLGLEATNLAYDYEGR